MGSKFMHFFHLIRCCCCSLLKQYLAIHRAYAAVICTHCICINWTFEPCLIELKQKFVSSRHGRWYITIVSILWLKCVNKLSNSSDWNEWAKLKSMKENPKYRSSKCNSVQQHIYMWAMWAMVMPPQNLCALWGVTFIFLQYEDGETEWERKKTVLCETKWKKGEKKGKLECTFVFDNRIVSWILDWTHGFANVCVCVYVSAELWLMMNLNTFSLLMQPPYPYCLSFTITPFTWPFSIHKWFGSNFWFVICWIKIEEQK